MKTNNLEAISLSLENRTKRSLSRDFSKVKLSTEACKGFSRNDPVGYLLELHLLLEKQANQYLLRSEAMISHGHKPKETTRSLRLIKADLIDQRTISITPANKTEARINPTPKRTAAIGVFR